MLLLSADLSYAGTGALTGKFLYKDSAGNDNPLTYGYVYLHSATKPPPMEKYFSKADYILGPTSTTPFLISNIPEGSYYVRLLQRKVPGGVNAQFGPPQQGDYTWFQTTPITITAGTTPLNLGTLYATPFGSAPIIITGTLTSPTGAPVTGLYVRAQTEPCTTDGQNNNVNQCGPAKYQSLQTTDANGKYTIFLKDPGVYYLYASRCLTTSYQQYTGNDCGFEGGPGPITLSTGDNKTFNFTFY